MELSRDEIGTLVIATHYRAEQLEAVPGEEVSLAKTKALHSKLCREYRSLVLPDIKQCTFQWSDTWGTHRCPHPEGHGYEVPMALPHAAKTMQLLSQARDGDEQCPK